MNHVTIHTALLGMKPYALVEVVDTEKAEVQAGGFDTNNPDEVAVMVKALSAATYGMWKHLRRVKKAKRAAKRAARRAHCA